MSRELLLMRHGKSDWDADADDFNRPITDRGKRAAQRIGVWLAGQELLPDYIISSPAERAITTAEKTAKAMRLDARSIHRDRRIYLASHQTLLQVLQDCPADAQRILLVGHNPGMDDLLSYLADAVCPDENGKLMTTATLARLAMPDSFTATTPAQGCAQLLSLTRPKNLPKKFPFPGPGTESGSNELRDRPAYYYQQSSVIPWRQGEHGVEIMVISSSQRKHQVVPKGIGEPGLSLQQSAAKEALEEAGIEGEVDPQELGSYHYKKWGAECTVYVYAMKVSREIPQDEWQESHRGRQWMSPKKAAKALKQKQLIPLMDALLRRQTQTTG